LIGQGLVWWAEYRKPVNETKLGTYRWKRDTDKTDEKTVGKTLLFSLLYFFSPTETKNGRDMGGIPTGGTQFLSIPYEEW
jgi:hypothetical protein